MGLTRQGFAGAGQHYVGVLDDLQVVQGFLLGPDGQNLQLPPTQVLVDHDDHARVLITVDALLPTVAFTRLFHCCTELQLTFKSELPIGQPLSSAAIG